MVPLPIPSLSSEQEGQRKVDTCGISSLPFYVLKYWKLDLRIILTWGIHECWPLTLPLWAQWLCPVGSLESVDLTHSFYFIMALPPWPLVFNQLFLQWEVGEAPFVFFAVHASLPHHQGPFQTTIFGGHLFCSPRSWAWQWVNDTQTSHIKMMCCMIINNLWVKGEDSKKAPFQESNIENISSNVKVY